MSVFNRKRKLLAAGVAAMAIAGAAVFQQYSGTAAVADAQLADAVQAVPAAKPVDIEIVRTSPVQIWKNFSARLEAVGYAQIRPQVSGTITEIRFEDGQMVNKGEILYVIDPRPYKAAVKQAGAQLNKARTESAFARKQLSRAKKLVKASVVSEQVYDERANAATVSRNAIQAAEAQLMQAEIDLDRAYVKAPISGRIGRAEVKLGNLVSAGANAPVLTSIVSNKGIYADFEVDENSYLTYIRPIAKNSSKEKTIPVRLRVGSGGLEYQGFVHSFDNRINAASGTIRARAYFANEHSELLPGMFGSLNLGSAVRQDHILVSETAIGTNQDRKFVYIVDDQDKALYREVQLGLIVGGKRIVTAGLKEGDRVISAGLMHIRPGMPVVAKDGADTERVAES